MPDDLAIIKELKKAIGIQLQQIEYDRIERYENNGYAVDEQGQVVGLNLDVIKKKNSPEILPKFKHLRKLSLTLTILKDYSFISSLSRLTNLYIGENQITDISALFGLNRLTQLVLTDNQITDISFLLGLCRLKELALGDNQITNISSLSGLNKLTHLDLVVL